MLLINETKIQYQINPSASKYIFFECKINNLQDGNSPLLTFFNPLTNQNQIKVFLNLSGQIVVFFNNVEYSSNIFVMLNTWFSFAVSLKAQNDDLYIELRVNTQSQELCIHQEANIHNLAFSLGSYNEVINDEIITYYLSGCIENLVYGDTYLSQARYNRLITAFINSYRYKESTYDIFGRLTKNELYENHNDLTTSYEYKSLGNKTTSLINKESHTYKNDNDETQTLISEYNYQYYSNSKLKLFTLNEEDTFQYGYDELGRISRFLKANDVSGDISINYQYDTYGNIISKVTTENNVSSTINYTYDSSNPILLIREGNRTYSYNGLYLISSSILVGTHFIVDTQYSYTGSKLSSITKLSGSSVSFKYGYNGLRRKKTIEERDLVTGEVSSSTEISYIYDNDKLILENHPDYQLRFQYDSLGKLYSIEKYDLDNNQVWKYYYIINILNDVLGLVNESGELVVSYLYDPYGNSLGITDLSDNNLSIVNPFRYKSYYFDEETGLYYLTTRYYNPSVGRFISPDSVDYLDSSSISGLNPFVYCGNDPLQTNQNQLSNRKLFNEAASENLDKRQLALVEYVLQPYSEKKWFDADAPSFMSISDSGIVFVSWSFSLFKGSLFPNEYQSNNYYVSTINLNSFVGFDYKKGIGFYVGLDAFEVGYDGKYMNFAFDFLSYNAIFSITDGKLNFSYGIGFFGYSFSIDFIGLFKYLFGGN